MKPPGIAWSPQEAAAINEFLNTPVGRKWLGILMARKPRIDMANTDRAGLTGAYSAGYESIFGEIAMTRVAMQPEEVSAKSLDMTKD
jgi:hypothetical protein